MLIVSLAMAERRSARRLSFPTPEQGVVCGLCNNTSGRTFKYPSWKDKQSQQYICESGRNSAHRWTAIWSKLQFEGPGLSSATAGARNRLRRNRCHLGRVSFTDPTGPIFFFGPTFDLDFFPRHSKRPDRNHTHYRAEA